MVHAGAPSTVFYRPNPPSRPHAPDPPFPYHGLEHIGFTVEHLDATIAALRAKGAEVAVGPLTRGAGTYLAFIRSPYGIMVELVEKRRNPG